MFSQAEMGARGGRGHQSMRSFTPPSWSFHNVRSVRVEGRDETWLPGGYGRPGGPGNPPEKNRPRLAMSQLTSCTVAPAARASSPTSWSACPGRPTSSRPLAFWPVRHRHGRRASEASGGSGDQDGSRADLTHRGSPRDRRCPCPPWWSESWPCVHQPSSPSSSANVPVGPSLPIVAIRTMFRALISTGRPRSFFTPPSSVAV